MRMSRLRRMIIKSGVKLEMPKPPKPGHPMSEGWFALNKYQRAAAENEGARQEFLGGLDSDLAAFRSENPAVAEASAARNRARRNAAWEDRMAAFNAEKAAGASLGAAERASIAQQREALDMERVREMASQEAAYAARTAKILAARDVIDEREQRLAAQRAELAGFAQLGREQRAAAAAAPPPSNYTRRAIEEAREHVERYANAAAEEDARIAAEVAYRERMERAAEIRRRREQAENNAAAREEGKAATATRIRLGEIAANRQRRRELERGEIAAFEAARAARAAAAPLPPQPPVYRGVGALTPEQEYNRNLRRWTRNHYAGTLPRVGLELPAAPLEASEEEAPIPALGRLNAALAAAPVPEKQPSFFGRCFGRFCGTRKGGRRSKSRKAKKTYRKRK